MRCSPQLIRILRIAWSVAWCLVTILLVLLWVRSYRNAEAIYRIGESLVRTVVVSDSGTISVACEDTKQIQSFVPATAHGWQYQEYGPNLYRQVSRFELESNAYEFTICVPNWFTGLVSVTLATLPWFPYRFSLRTLLIAMTLVSAGLGLVVWLW